MTIPNLRDITKFAVPIILAWCLGVASSEAVAQSVPCNPEIEICL